jgi:AcrR family transcriptional regulator
MSTTKTNTGRPKKGALTEEALIDAYIKELLIHGKMPASVFAFTDGLGIQESDFYKFFSSFEALEMALWDDLMKRTLDTLNADEKFADFSAREKLLAFYFTHLEVLKERRSFVAMRWPQVKNKPSTPKALKAYRENFMNFANLVVEEGIERH